MSTIHLCNTFFEAELEGKTPPTLESAFFQNKIFLQLQFLPLLYGLENERFVATTPLALSSPYYLLTDAPSATRLQTWGHSKLVKAWADQRGIFYDIPPWDVVQKVNSKAYSFSKSPLPGAFLLYPKDKLPSNMVLKSCFGTAGQGHIFSNDPKALHFCQQQWGKNLPVIAEPWVSRTIDFSSQWVITNKEIIFLGMTLCHVSSKGVHMGNTAKKFSPLPSYMQKHQEFAFPILQEMQELGYFGEVGIDAMVYGDNILQPVVEINARKTMGWLTLQLHQRKYLNNTLTLSYLPSLLVTPLPKQLHNIKFSRQVIITIQ